MKKKILAAREALHAGVSAVIIADSRRPEPIRAALAEEGTLISDLGVPVSDLFRQRELAAL
jgi:acetylglutamate kinase